MLTGPPRKTGHIREERKGVDMSTKTHMEQNKKPRKYRVYSAEFKKEAVELAKELGSAETSRKLGVPLSNIDKWRSGHSMKAAVSPSEKEYLNEIKQLKRELERSHAVIEVLKKTAAIFSKDHLT